jgi:hypothetical protein
VPVCSQFGHATLHLVHGLTEKRYHRHLVLGSLPVEKAHGPAAALAQLGRRLERLDHLAA